MKKILTLICAVTMLTACSLKEGRVFSETPDDKLTAVLTEYSDMLTSSPNGWLLSVNTQVDGGFTHWVTFDKNLRCVMMSDLDVTRPAYSTSTTPAESSYFLKALQNIALIFDTYNYLHCLADPQGADNSYRPGNGGVNGEGLISDFEFYIRSTDNGRVIMEGRYNKTQAIMIPATAAEAAKAMAGGLKTMHLNQINYLNSADFLEVTIEGIPYFVQISSRSVNLIREKGGKGVSVSQGSYIDMLSVTTSAPTNNIYFFSPMPVSKAVSISAFKWGGTSYNAIGTDGAVYEVKEVAQPPIKLQLGPGNQYTKLRTKKEELTGTLTNPFLTNIYDAAYNNLNLNGGGRKIQYFELLFTDDPMGRPCVELSMPYLSGTTIYIAKWRYKYTLYDDNTITFTDRDQSGTTNELSREQFVKVFLNYFCDVQYSNSPPATNYGEWVKSSTTPRTFKIQWVKNRTLGSGAFIGGFVPVDDPTNVYCGILMEK